MGFKEVQSLDSDVTIALGGVNKKTGKPNAVQAEGYYLGTRQVKSEMSKDGTADIHFLQTPKGNVGVWGKTDLDRKIKGVTPGAMIRITHTGMQKVPGKRDMYKFKVEVDNENCIEVETGSAAESVGNSGDADSYDDSSDFTECLDGFGETASLDEISPPRASPPARPAAAPDAARQAKVKELLAKGRARTA